ncbi:zinc metalloproteinase nas-4-like [Paramacrobiotus metropolitanus]|uniref:zinc metalloproteinase nas-4-like n=1 Tax=Paramacrobiotus metropolitanus TaxID=2943436 RepID=UPI002446026F|nr:zinc metalloproteinase nas-4-like [Paramacrobiotus metropolitanus]
MAECRKVTDCGCNSYVGKLGKNQTINLEVSSTGYCLRFKTVLHELMHTVGFYHEQSREDRDTYVETNRPNIQPKYYYAFDKISTTTFGLPYDIYSVMHYGRYYFAINREVWTIRPKGTNWVLENFGSHNTLFTEFTPNEVRKLKAMYPYCGRGYSGTSLHGSWWTFVNGHYLPNLSADIGLSIKSAQVESGCTMRVCTAANFGGSCAVLTSDLQLFSAPWYNNIGSLSCLC